MARLQHALRTLTFALGIVCSTGGFSRAALVPTGFSDELVVSGVGQASNFDFLPDGRVLVVEQWTAKIRLVATGAIIAPDPVGVVPDVQAIGGEQGLLGIAVDPRWPLKPYIYVHYTAASTPNIHVRRYELTGDLDGTKGTGLTLDLASARDILADLPDDYPAHNGGTLLFGADGMLYVSLGEDGVPCSAQDIHQLRGKILRLDVTQVAAGPGPAPDYIKLTAIGNPFAGDPDPRARLVWQYGLRNPWSYDLDPTTGTMVIADVGNSAYEEIDITTGNGRNFGWPLYEGPWRFEYPCVFSDTLTLTPPTYWYQRPSPDVPAAIILGGICRPIPRQTTEFPPEYNGNVFYTDLYEGSLKRLICENGTCGIAPPVPGQPSANSWATGMLYPARIRFGSDGALWYAASGELRRIVSGIAVGVDPQLTAPSRASLGAWPVPAVGRVQLRCTLPARAIASVFITDARGRRVRTVMPAGLLEAGEHGLAWEGNDDRGRRMPAGLYFGVFETGGRTMTRRLILLGGSAR